MMNDQDILVGNYEDLQAFKKHFSAHDRVTLESYFRIAKKKEAMLLIRRHSLTAPFMQLLIVPYKLAETTGGLREAIKIKQSRFSGFIQPLPVETKKLFVFGELLPKNDLDLFSSILRKSKKRLPFSPRNTPSETIQPKM